MGRQLLHFFQAVRLFTTDPPVGAVVADVQYIRYGINQRNMFRQQTFDVLKKSYLYIG